MQNMLVKTNAPTAKLDTRSKRRKEIRSISALLGIIRNAEEDSLRRYPDSLQETDQYIVGAEAVESLDEIIDLLNDVY